MPKKWHNFEQTKRVQLNLLNIAFDYLDIGGADYANLEICEENARHRK